MCGIVGALAFGEFKTPEEEKARQEAMIFFTSELLQLTETRGKEATGIATMFGNCDFMGLKMGIESSKFISRYGKTEKDFAGFLNIWRKKASPAKITIGHCRKPSYNTSATADDNKNNHPIKTGDILGVHNGTLTNDDQIFKNLACGRDGKVDSEAIFRLLKHFTKNGTEPFTDEILQETCKRLHGTYAVLTFSGNNPYQLAAFRDGRPIEFALIKPLKLLLIASEVPFINIAIARYNRMANLYAPVSKYVALVRDSVEMVALPEYSTALFDLRKDVNDETKLIDLYSTEKISLQGKLWAKPTAAANTTAWQQNPPHRGNINVPATGTEVNVNKSTKKKDDKKSAAKIVVGDGDKTGGERVGMAWNRRSAKYESVSGIESTKFHSNVEIDCESGEIVEAVTGIVVEEGEKKHSSQTSHPASDNQSTFQENFSLTETAKCVDDLISEKAKINIIGSTNTRKTCEDSTKIEGGSTVEKDLTEYPEIIKKAVKATEEEPCFSNNDDLANALEITNKEAMGLMSMYSLANRIRKFFFRKAWYEGYLARMQEEIVPKERSTLANYLLRTKNKVAAASKTIRHMKTLTKILSALPNNTDSNLRNKIEKEVSAAMNSGDELNSAILKKIFREGDLRDNEKLRSVMQVIENKESR